MRNIFKNILFIMVVCSTILLMVSCNRIATTEDISYSEDIYTSEIESQSDQEWAITDPISDSSVDSITDTKDKTLADSQDSNEVSSLADEELLLGTMSLTEKIRQLFFVAYTDYLESGEDYGGVIFFTTDLGSTSETKEKTKDLMMSMSVTPFVAIDEEGGIVTRITGDKSPIGYEKLPSPYNMYEESGASSVAKYYDIIGNQLSELGFNMDFAPVADIFSNPENTIIGKRAFGNDAQRVTEGVFGAVTALKDRQIIACAKHFPGHGDTYGDSHLNTVYDLHTMDELLSTTLIPFSSAISIDVPFIMMGHITYPNIAETEGLPASMSSYMIEDILRNSMGYSGIIISDAMNMKAITDIYPDSDISVEAFEAGLDMFLMLRNPEHEILVLESYLESHPEKIDLLDEKVLRILKLKMAYGLYFN